MIKIEYCASVAELQVQINDGRIHRSRLRKGTCNVGRDRTDASAPANFVVSRVRWVSHIGSAHGAIKAHKR